MLKDRVILITGSNSGIGFASAQLCIRHGAKVMLHGLEEKLLQQSVDHLGHNAAFVVADLMDARSPGLMIENTINKFGRIDGLVNNAARLDRNSIETITDEIFETMMRINVQAPLALIQAVLPHMKTQKTGGSIVNIGSINAHCGASNLLIYSMTKGALMTATRNMGDALGGTNVRINQLNVGWTLTENERLIQRSEGQPEDWLDHIPKSHAPSGTILMPEQIGAHVVFWLSNNSAPVTGQVCDVEQYPLIGRNHIS